MAAPQQARPLPAPARSPGPQASAAVHTAAREDTWERDGGMCGAARTSTASKSCLLRIASSAATCERFPGFATICTLVLPVVGAVAAVLEA